MKLLGPIQEPCLYIHTGIQVVPDDEIAALLDKQIVAMQRMDENPFAAAMNVKVRRYFRDNVVEMK